MIDFVHLHLHTEYSLLDGACKIKEVIKQAKRLKQSAIAITDHGVMYGAIDFYKEAKKEGIKPIIGCEVYLARRTRFDKNQTLDARSHHLVLLCKNEIGYKNLLKLVSEAYIHGFYHKPRIDKSLLEEYSEGLIGLSACLAGEIPRLIEQGDYEGAKKEALWYKKVFGEDNFYLEMMDHGIEMQKTLNKTLLRLSKETGIGLVATNDCHYIKKEDAKVQDILIRIQTNITIEEESALEFTTDEFYLKDGNEMSLLFPKEAIENTIKIADRCNLDFKFGEIKLPRFALPNVENNEQYFIDMCYKGLEKHYGENPSIDILNRLKYEIDLIIKMGYVDYFLIVHDFVSYAKENDIPVGPGRGSGAGSIAAFCIGITGIDPIKYGLIFERFLNPERITMPDFDIDFCYERRQEVIEYVENKYGSDHVAQIIAFGTMAARSAIRDVARAMAIPYAEADKVAKMIPIGTGITLTESLKKSKELKTLVESNKSIKDMFDMALKVEGMPRHASTHAAGVVITTKRVVEYVPLAVNDNSIVTQYNMGILEELGLLKMDFLGLRNLTVIKKCSDMVKKHDERFDIEKIPLDSQKVFDMFSNGETEGIFQFESEGLKKVLQKLRPENLEDIIALTSLYRPGPMDSIPKYIECRHNPDKVIYKHPLLKSVLLSTYGIIVYQEQVMEIFRKLAGYSYARADLVRRAMSSKNHDVMQKERKNFIFGLTLDDGRVECVGAIANGVSEKIAGEIFEEMARFASYAFNKSHAAAYALISYRTAYLKTHYEKEYMAALLSSASMVNAYFNETKRLGIKLLTPDINESNLEFSVENNDVRFGLLAIKNLGRGFIDKIILERDENGKFISMHDFCKRLAAEGMNKKALESLIKSGAMDCFGSTRRDLFLNLEKIIAFTAEEAKIKLAGQFTLFDSAVDSINDDTLKIGDSKEFSQYQKLEYEKEVLGFYISGHPLEEYEERFKNIKIDEISKISEEDTFVKSKYQDNQNISVFGIITKTKTILSKKNQTMAFLNIEDLTGTIECILFPAIFSQVSGFIGEGNIVYIKGRISISERDGKKILIENIYTPEMILNEKRKNENSGLYLQFSSKKSDDFRKAKEVLKKSSGDMDVFIYFSDEKMLLKASEKYRITPIPTIISELKSLLGEKNVVIKK